MEPKDYALGYWTLDQYAKNDWLAQSLRHSLVFRRPLYFRCTAAAVAAFFLFPGAILLHAAIKQPSTVFEPSLLGRVTTGAAVLFAVSIGVYLWCLAGPSVLAVDLSQRTYRFRWGFPFLAWRSEGNLEEIRGLYVSHHISHTGPVNRLFLTWRKRGRPKVMLAVFHGEMSQAETYLGQVSRLLEVAFLPTYRTYEHSVVWKLFGPNHWLTGGK